MYEQVFCAFVLLFLSISSCSPDGYGFCPGILPQLIPKRRPQFLSNDDWYYSEKRFTARTEPFRALFIVADSVSTKSKQSLAPAIAHVNEVLGRALSASRLVSTKAPMDVCNGHRIPKDSTHRDSMGEYTMVIYVHVSMKRLGAEVVCKEKGPIVAYALPCIEFSEHFRPTHSTIIFCHQIEEYRFDVDQVRVTVLHEMIHAIMGWTFWNDWVSIHQHDYKMINGSRVLRGVVATPNVLKAARLHFRCDTAEGAELDIFPFTQPAYDGSNVYFPNFGHWSTRLFAEELMSPTVLHRKKLSVLTLAFLQDTGWYQVNFSHAEPLTYSRPHPLADGCALAKMECTEYMAEQRERSGDALVILPYCDTRSTRCSPDGRITMQCDTVHDWINHCPVLLPIATPDTFYDCRSDRHPIPSDLRSIGLQLGTNSICTTFDRPLPLPSKTKFPYASCLEFECRIPDTVIVKFNPPNCPNENYHIECPQSKSGQLIEYTPHDHCGRRKIQHVKFFCPDFTHVCSSWNNEASLVPLFVPYRNLTRQILIEYDKANSALGFGWLVIILLIVSLRQ